MRPLLSNFSKVVLPAQKFVVKKSPPAQQRWVMSRGAWHWAALPQWHPCCWQLACVRQLQRIGLSGVIPIGQLH
jgi:hypothetical protein